ncbi:hypothetical protein LJR225_000173 [Phenylobacterium sp. LjRoot225]|uniref:hypothetical protein n=1 Tax=Phenylobacterium sp. LjRoot225 TaxID=3342285 RepID=UPI003ECC6360
MIETRTVKAGVLYCVAVSGAALVLGLVRILWVTPLAGEAASLALEAPVMIAIAWYACGWAAEQMEVSQHFVERLAMGGVALAVMIGAEAAIAILAAQHSAEEFFRDYVGSSILLGLLAQVAFAVLPLLRRRGG